MESNGKLQQRKCIYFFRQLLVCSGTWVMFFMTGQMVGAPTVIIPQLRKNNSTELSDDLTSWMYSAIGFSSVPWLFVLPPLMRAYGPRVPYIVACIDMMIVHIIFFFSVTPQQILISEVVLGLANANCLTIGIIIISEYSSPRYRGIFLTIKSATIMWGIWSANAIGTFFHWKCIAYTGFLCSIYTFSFIFWPESPHWLARNGRFEECRASYRWLNGEDENSEKDLEELIASQLKEKNLMYSNDWSSFVNALRTMASKPFYRPLVIAVLLIVQYTLGGKFLCAIYSIEILKKMTASEPAAYIGMLFLDGVTVLSMYFGCFLAKILKRRTLHLTSSFIAVAFMLIMSIYMFLVKFLLVAESQVLSIALMTCFSVATGCGPMILNTSIYSELLPARFKWIQILITGLCFYICTASILKVAPLMFRKLGMHGTFLFLGLSSGLCNCLLYKYLPETKNMTLQKIEENFNDADDVGSENSETERLNTVTSRIKENEDKA